jgi:16S rRNA (guanine527-N7)-methyltransferase
MKLFDIAPVSRETVDRLEVFVDLFKKWSARINLTARGDDDIWNRHVADSLQLAALVPTPKRWYDLGSGGGFPGLITAIVLCEHDDGWVHLIESNQKKAAFLRAALHETGGRGSVHPLRIEQAIDLPQPPEAISARALADLDTLLELTAPWTRGHPELTAWLHKGRDYRREVAKARDRWDFDLVEHASKIDPESVILQISRIARL